MHLQLVELDNDLKSLKGYERVQDKQSHKRDKLLPKWLPIVDKYLADIANGEKNYENPLFANCIIWLFDVGDFDRALSYGYRALELGQPTPDRIRRKWPSFIADFIFEWAEEQAEQGNSVEPYFSDVFNNVTGKWKLHEAITAKYYKLAGLQLLRDPLGEIKASAIGDIDILQKSDRLLEQASNLHKHSGVKTLRARIAMRLRALEVFKGEALKEL